MESRKCSVCINGETREYDAGTSYQDIAEEFQPRYERRESMTRGLLIRILPKSSSPGMSTRSCSLSWMGII